MCEGCRTPRIKEWTDGNLILKPGEPCKCDDCSITEMGESTLPTCLKCGCMIPILIVGVNDQVGFDDIYVDPLTKHPVKL